MLLMSTMLSVGTTRLLGAVALGAAVGAATPALAQCPLAPPPFRHFLQYVEFPIPTTSSEPYGITAGPDGALWFTESFSNNIGRIPTTATIANPQFTEFAIEGPTFGSNSEPYGITANPTDPA